MKKTMVYLSEEQQLLLKQRARKRGVSMAALIREAVDGFLVREKPEVDYMAIVGMAEGVPGENVSERVDEVLAEIIKTNKPPPASRNAHKKAN